MDINPIDKQVGSNIRSRREARKLSREALGAALSVPVTGTAIEKYEAGVNRVSASSLVEIAGVLDCILSDFFDGIPQIMKANTRIIDKQDPPADSREIGFPTVIEEMEPEVQKAVTNLVDAIIMSVTRKFQSPAR